MTGQTLRKGALLDSGTPSPNPWDLSLSRQNVCSTMKALEPRIGLRRDATRAPIQGPEWQRAGSHSRPQNSTPRPRRALAYCGQKMVFGMGSTLGGLRHFGKMTNVIATRITNTGSRFSPVWIRLTC
jgi:hypothetical protein